MSIYRTYIDSQATLIKDNYTNNSKNPVLELVRGNDLYSRFIFSLDLSDVRNKIEENYYTSANTTSHIVSFKSGVFSRENLIGKRYVNGEFLRDSGYELTLSKFDENFTEGVNFDYIYSTGITFTVDTVNSQTPNWFYKDELTTWNTEGVYSGTPLNVWTTQSFTNGNEDINFDVTTQINDFLFNETGNTLNLMISYSPQYETGITGTNKYVTTFFGKYTQTVFEPYFQTTFDDVIKDDRNTFFLDVDNELYLYTKREITSVDRVEIYDYNGELYTTLTGNSISRVNKLTYKINLNIPSDDYPDLVNFTDKWYYTVDGVSKTQENEFTLLTEKITDEDYFSIETSEISFKTFGLNENELVKREENPRTIQIYLKRLNNNFIQDDLNITNLQYRLYTIQADNVIEVIPYTNVNTTPNKYFINLDTSWLIPSTYYLEFRVNNNNILILKNNLIKFKVTN